jgi:3',5'-cyclic AMP phosphodiesterase CpdA
MANNLAQAIREIQSLPKPPGAVLVNGDCAFASGQTADYETFGQLLDPLRRDRVPLHLLLGNHDHREHFLGALTWARSGATLVEEKFVSLVETPRVNWFLLDSLETTNSTPGLLGQAQLAWLAGALDARPSRPALVVVHHNPGLAGNLGLKDTIALLDILRARKQVKAYFFGHTHSWSVQTDEAGMHLVNLPAVSYVFQEGQPTGWVELSLLGGGMCCELRCLDPKHPAHRQKRELTWRSS